LFQRFSDLQIAINPHLGEFVLLLELDVVLRDRGAGSDHAGSMRLLRRAVRGEDFVVPLQIGVARLLLHIPELGSLGRCRRVAALFFDLLIDLCRLELVGPQTESPRPKVPAADGADPRPPTPNPARPALTTAASSGFVGVSPAIELPPRRICVAVSLGIIG
jgi:hypothetical protein